ncbi:DUF1516 family protein [Furfurilactobacillus siliginis]|uniref:DUF1516 domain-containing protein n=1 Tax=Furfurilactobacillus siliginis TaxID=348151 RepID=A0A0R2KYW9_9LACO|nr:DUF1516 family protein [Furfurilactobacillus siliginis]KRN94696.1 hypothetical protein IV55_GL000465 [Furfurilactobacillus siliginis]GEK28408.1 hypothetical protein LSI01_07190 [Furfurilactobacillus siliginis]
MTFLIASRWWLIAAFVLSAEIGLSRKTEKRVKLWLMIGRLVYLLLIVTLSVTFRAVFAASVLQAILLLILAAALITVSELAYARKQETKTSHPLLISIPIIFALMLIVSFL